MKKVRLTKGILACLYLALYLNLDAQELSKEMIFKYPVSHEKVRLTSYFVNFGMVSNDTILTKTIGIYNKGSDSIHFNPDSIASSSFIDAKFDPNVLAPKAEGLIYITLKTRQKINLGYNEDGISIRAKGIDEPIALNIVSIIKEAKLTISPDETAPRLAFDRSQHDFGLVDDGDSLTTTFTLTNHGQSTLEIRRIEGNCSCVGVAESIKEIPAGQSKEITVYFNTEGRKYSQYKNLTIISNDPTAPFQVISLKAKVRE